MVLVLAALPLSACGEGQIIANVDVYSFLDPADTQAAYDQQVIAGVGFVPLLNVVPPTEVNLIEGMGSVTILEEGVLTFKGDLVNAAGTASARVSVILADDAQSIVLGGNAVLDVDVDVVPSATTPFEGSVILDEQTLDIFSNETLWVRVDLQASVPPSFQPQQITGQAVLTELRARLVSSDNFF